MQTYNQEVLENNWGSREKRARSALSALGFRTGGQPQSVDYGGGDKSGLTDTEDVDHLPPPQPSSPRAPGRKPAPWDVGWITCVRSMGGELQQPELFFFFLKSKIQSLKEAVTKKKKKQQIKHSMEGETKRRTR